MRRGAVKCQVGGAGAARSGIAGAMLIFAASVFFAGWAYAVEVTFPDAHLEAAIRKAINKPTGAILDSDLAKLTSLNASFSEIADLTGLEYCAGLKTLQLQRNQVADISVLAGLTQLMDLYFWENQISDITALADLPDLRNVFLRDNLIRDISALEANAGLGPLDVVDVSKNPVEQDGLCSTVPALEQRGVRVILDEEQECNPSNFIVRIPDPALNERLHWALQLDLEENLHSGELATLTTFDAANAGIKDITGLDYCSNLTELRLNGNRISSIRTLALMSRIHFLYLGGNAISDLTPLAQSYALFALELQDQHADDGFRTLADITALQFLTALRYVSLSDNAVVDITPLRRLTSLIGLYLNGNDVEDLAPLRYLTDLALLDVGDNPIADFAPLSSLTNLESLGIWKTEATSLASLVTLGQLVYLDASNNALADIQVLAGLSNLQTIALHNNQIVNLTSLAGIPNLYALTLQNNKINDISPLVANSSLGTQQIEVGGHFVTVPDRIDVRDNRLSLDNLCNDIPALQERGAIVEFDGSCDEYGTSYSLTTAVAAAGTGTIEPAEGTRRYAEGTEVIVEATPTGDNVFDHWEGDATGTQNPITVTMDSDKHVTAVFGEVSGIYTLTMTLPKGNGNVNPAIGAHTYLRGTEVAVSATPDPGWQFDHWEGSLTGSDNAARIVMDTNKTITAVFVKQQLHYTLTTQISGNGTVAPAPGAHQYAEGAAVTLTATPAQGWEFDHWDGDVSGTEDTLLVGMYSDVAAVAVFVEKGPERTLTTSVTGIGTISPAAGTHTYEDGEIVEIVATPLPGAVFDHWEGDLAGSGNPASLIMDADKTVTAVFTSDGFDFTLSVIVGGSGATDPPSGFYRFMAGDAITLNATPDVGWVFDHWEGALTGDDLPVTLTMDGDKTVKAVFLEAPVIYSLTMAVQGGGATKPLLGTRAYAANKQVTIIAIPAPNWAFDHWEGDYAGTANPAVVKMDESKEITAVFRARPTIAFVSPNRGLTLGGERIQIVGGSLASASAVLFGSAPATILSSSETVVEVTTPGHTADVVDVTVVTPSGDALAENGFTYVNPPDPPTVGAVQPAYGATAGGDVVVIRGQNLAMTRSVTFGGILAGIVSAEETRLQVVTPQYTASAVDVVVTTATGSATASDAFTYLAPPTITSISPNAGPDYGGTTVRIHGSALLHAGGATFGGLAAHVVSVADDELVAVTPGHAAGFVDVAVTTPGGGNVVAGAFDYFANAASLTCVVEAAASGAAITDATVRVEPGGLRITGSFDGVYVFSDLRPATYAVTVTASGYTAQSRDVTLLADEAGTVTFRMVLAATDPGICGTAAKRLDAAIFETTAPLCLAEAPAGVVSCNGPLAIRVQTDDPVDPGSVWAVLEGENGTASGGLWRPSSPGDDRDGWVVFTPEAPLSAGQTVKLTVGAVTIGGAVLDPLSCEYLVGEGTAAAAGVAEDAAVTGLPDLLGAAQSAVYRIGPAGVFAEPMTVQLPVADAIDAESLEVYYYSESTKHTGWYRASNVTGWMVGESRRTVEVGGKTFVEFQVNHAGVVQLGKAAEDLMSQAGLAGVTASGDSLRWWALASTLLVLSITLGAIRQRARRN